jgi:hypothetical protein
MSQTSASTVAYRNANCMSHRGDLIIGAGRGINNKTRDSSSMKIKIVKQRGHHDAIGDGVVHRSPSISNAQVDGDILSTTDVAVTVMVQRASYHNT